MAKGISPCRQLSALYELETELCISASGSHAGDVLGGQILQLRDNSDDLKDDDNKRR